MVVIFQGSGMSAHDQDIKPMLNQYMNLSADSLPALSFSYDQSVVTTREPYAFIEFLVRKMGHISEYAVLTLLAFGVLAATKLSRGWMHILALIFPLLYAMSDEWHQSFIAERTGHLIDVGVDFIGIVLAHIVFILIRKIVYARGRRKIKRKYAFSQEWM